MREPVTTTSATPLVAPLAVLGLTDAALTALYGWQPPLNPGDWTAAVLGWVARYGVLFLLAWWALRARRGGGDKALTLLGVTAADSGVCDLVTNTLAWLTLGGYARTFAGWAQALTVGLPGYLPSWIFFRNALVSDLLYSTLLLVALRLSSSRARAAGSPAPLVTARL